MKEEFDIIEIVFTTASGLVAALLLIGMILYGELTY